MKIITELEYYRKLSFLLRRVIEELPPRTEITRDFHEANTELSRFKKNFSFESTMTVTAEYEGINQIEVSVWPDFDDFWDLYDKKVGKKSKLEKKWSKLSQSTKEKIMEYIPNYVISQPRKQYRMNPETFLNNDGWENEIIMLQEKPSNDQRMIENAKKNLTGW